MPALLGWLSFALTFEDGYDLKTEPGELNNLSDQIDPEHEEHMLLLRGFIQVHTYRENGYRVPYPK